MSDRHERFTGLYRRYYRNVSGFVLLRLDGSSAEDVVAETFLVAWRRLDELVEPELPWLLGTARNMIRSQYRRAASSSRLAERVAELAVESMTDVAERVAERHDAVAVLGRLGGKDVEVLALTAWHGLDAEQGALVLDMSPQGFKSRLHRARKRLAKAMDGASLPGHASRSLLQRQEHAS